MSDKIYVYHKDNIVYEWNDGASYNYPEDLTWGRSIEDVFNAGLKLGAKGVTPETLVIRKDNTCEYCGEKNVPCRENEEYYIICKACEDER